jgi:hypothetical protein
MALFDLSSSWLEGTRCPLAARGYSRDGKKGRLQIDEATSRGDFNPRAQWCLELAKLHTALAHVAATALTSDGGEWARGRRLQILRYEFRPAAGQDLNPPGPPSLLCLRPVL